jgi:outer membrane protein insertion porin family
VSLAWGYAFAVSPLMAQEPTLEGRQVTEVRIVDQSGQSSATAITLPSAPGKPFDIATERESLRELYATGDYSNIQVTAENEAAGLRINFVVQRNFYNNVIRVLGLKEPPTEPAALASLRLGLGEPFRESSLREAVDRLKQTLGEEGFYEAKVTWELTPHESTRQMDITVTVDIGPRAIIGDVKFQNHTRFTDLEIQRHSKISLKKPLTSARVSHGAQQLKKFLVDQGYLGAGVVITPGAYDPKTNLVPLTYDVTAGPQVKVQVSGARLRKSRLRKLLPIYAEGAADDDLLQEGRRNIRDYFQSQGYFNADVEVRTEGGDQGGDRVITYDISRGDRFRLAGISFNGNHYFSRALLAARLQLQTASFASSGRFSQQLARADSDSIRNLYLSNGFLDAQVNFDVDDNYQGKKGNLFVAFHVTEGTQALVQSLEIDGNKEISTDALLAVTGSTSGQPYSDANVASDRNNILAMYYDAGYPEARFREEILPGDAPIRKRLVYHVTEGTRIEVTQVLLTGYQFTRPGIILRQVQIHPAEPLRESQVVETQRQLYNLGVFNRVQIAPQNPDGTDPLKAVVVEAQEGSRYTIGYGFGFEVQKLAGGSTNPTGTTIGASPRGIFEISRSNMFGRAQTLSFRARASTLQYRALLGFTANNLLTKKNLSLQLSTFADKTQDVNTFTSHRYEGSFQVVQTLSPWSSLLYRYFYRRVEVSNISNTINPNEIPLLSQPTLVSGFGITYARDHRDNPGDATRGTFNTVDISDAVKTLGSSASFFRGFFQNSSFTPFGRAFVFARSTRFGIEEPLGNTLDLDIPLPERFFAGGGTSFRGFGLNQAGPRDQVTGFPIGGLALLEFNQEIRFPMKLPFVGTRLGGTLLYDGGNVYSDVNNISLAWKPKSSSENNLDYFSHTVGFGIRYPTPVGPVRLDFGYQINPAEYMGTNSANQPQMFRLPHFQFFFNIGPVF